MAKPGYVNAYVVHHSWLHLVTYPLLRAMSTYRIPGHGAQIAAGVVVSI